MWMRWGGIRRLGNLETRWERRERGVGEPRCENRDLRLFDNSSLSSRFSPLLRFPLLLRVPRLLHPVEKLLLHNLPILYFIHADFFHFMAAAAFHGGVIPHGDSEVVTCNHSGF